MSNKKFQNALNLIPQAVPPIWFMRQAGRYHDHYQNLKKTYTFEQLCKNPELAAEVALGPIQDFDFDVSILFSDILFPLEGLGVSLRYDPGPILDPLLSRSQMDQLKSVDEAAEFLKFQGEAVKATREALPKDKSLIGFIGGPWTLYTYATEGAHKGNLLKAKNDPELMHDFLNILTQLLIKNIKNQLDNGAEVVMIFDTAVGEVSESFFRAHLLPYLNKIFEQYTNQIVYYGKGITPGIYAGIEGIRGFGFDHRWNIVDKLKQTNRKIVQGNFDQSLLFTDPEIFPKLLREYLAPIKELSQEERKGWVCGLGHGVLPKTPQENVRNFIKITREFFDE